MRNSEVVWYSCILRDFYATDLEWSIKSKILHVVLVWSPFNDTHEICRARQRKEAVHDTAVVSLLLEIMFRIKEE